ncbi:hypothetical protein [Rhizobium sp. BK176]|uniref:hypothetical protein n=1 Tax=Rhizobium sp. BK176 TaxID=2587071 RepID=UPI002167C0F2|nr:hypothetical protein [Rhizobium sp. BK176]MCS4089251.1 hypothetical protein [Rhizobium sp. BK176]
MSLQRVAAQIEFLAGPKLAELGLTLVLHPSENPASEDHSILFTDARARAHAVSVQVDSNSPSLANSSLSIEHVELKPIEGTPLSCVKSGWAHAELRSNTIGGRVEEILRAIGANNWFIPVDDVEAGIVTDFRWEKIIPKMREHFFDGEVKLSSSVVGQPSDTVEIIHGGKTTAKAALAGQAVIRVSYETLAGDERVLEYVGLAKFEANIDKDLGGRPASTAGIGPRI